MKEVLFASKFTEERYLYFKIPLLLKLIALLYPYNKELHITATFKSLKY